MSSLDFIIENCNYSHKFPILDFSERKLSIMTRDYLAPKAARTFSGDGLTLLIQYKRIIIKTFIYQAAKSDLN